MQTIPFSLPVTSTHTGGRLFSTHVVRHVHSLDGLWTLHTPSEGTKIDPASWAAGRARDYLVPSVWEAMPGLENYRGQAVARLVFNTATVGPARLVFRGVSHTARVFIDGREIGGHHNAHTPFAFDLPTLAAGSHEMLVHISNEHDAALSALHFSNDYYNYGGLTRPVELQQFGSPLGIRRVHATPRRAPDGTWSLFLQAKVVNLDTGAREAVLRVGVAGATHTFGSRSFALGETLLEADLACPGVAPWSPESPRLYELKSELIEAGRVTDDWCDRIGFRTVACRAGRILLNDQEVFFAGFNRHEDHGAHGCALPLATMHQDVLLLRDLNANAVRTSHYPNDERFLDLCDQAGLMVWEENHARGITLAQMRHPLFRPQCRDCIAEMIEWHYNHPSIVLWGILNECASHDPEGRALYAEQFAQIKSLDTSRPTTFASCVGDADICQDLPDVCAWNIYPGWYGDQDADVARTVDKLVGLSREHGGADTPVIFSEFGAGAIPGYIDLRRRAKFSENRQVDILRAALDVILAHPEVSGAFIWQFCDVRVDEGWAMGRPREMNDKGIVSEFRVPKLAYPMVKELFGLLRAGELRAAHEGSGKLALVK